MATPSSGPVAASPAGSKSRNKPRPAMPGGGVFIHGAGFLCLADVVAVRLHGSLLRSFLKKAAPKTSVSKGKVTQRLPSMPCGGMGDFAPISSFIDTRQHFRSGHATRTGLSLR